MANLKLSSQDVRDKIISLRDELILNLEFIQSAIRQDREKLMAYFAQHGDLRYRPVTAKDINGKPTQYGDPTEIFIEPLATQARTTVKSLLDSIRVIESEILPEDDPEGRQAGAGSGEEGMRARARLRQSYLESAGAEGLPQPIDAGPVARTPKETPVERPVIATPSRPSAMREAAEKIAAALPGGEKKDDRRPPAPADLIGARQERIHAEAKPRPWHETKAGAPEVSKAPPVEPEVRSNVVVAEPEEKPKADPRQVGLSPLLRASLGGTVTESRMAAMKKKYEKKDEE